MLLDVPQGSDGRLLDGLEDENFIPQCGTNFKIQRNFKLQASMTQAFGHWVHFRFHLETRHLVSYENRTIQLF